MCFIHSNVKISVNARTKLNGLKFPGRKDYLVIFCENSDARVFFMKLLAF